ncbi:MAG: hypothetical protein GY796_12055, partial [Chloroflexi bacterium]|nr:hypothetical protein [Chloroflexota bacterium]
MTNRQAAHTRLSDWVDGWLIIMVFAWLGARSGFVAANWEYYQLRPSEIWLLWDGGLSYHGALLGGCIGLGLWCIWGKRPWFPYAAQFAPALALISAFGWAACWFDGCAYGLPTTLGPLAADLPDEFGVFAVRYQTQLLGIILSLGVFTAVLT